MSDAEREQHWRRMAEAGWSLDGRSVRELLARLDAERERADKAEREVRRLRAIAQEEYDGAMAYLTGNPITANPFTEPSESWHQWRRGWQRVSDREMVCALAASGTGTGGASEQAM